MSNIVDDLLCAADDDGIELNASVSNLLKQAADEIARLRLTDEEREAVAWAVSAAEDCQHPADDALRGLLERHFPAPENPPPQDNTPEQHPNPDEVSFRPECSISPAWMARPFYVDPAKGWAYGFPRLYDPAKDGDMNAWLVANGYPQHLADQNLPCTFTAQTEH